MVANEHLGQFKPGISGNPAGRPKGAKNFSAILRRFLDVEIEFEDETVTIQEKIVMVWIKKAMEGDLKAIEMIMDRTDGKVANVTQLELPTEKEKIVLPLLVVATE